MVAAREASGLDVRLARSCDQIRPHLNDDPAAWAKVIKSIMPSAKLGERIRIEMALKAEHAKSQHPEDENLSDGEVVMEYNEPPSPAAAAPSPAVAPPLKKKLLTMRRMLARVPALECEETLTWWEVLHFPQVMVRETPSVSAQALGTALFGEILAIASIEMVGNARWARLASAERDNLAINFQRKEPRPAEAWMLIDGAQVGLGQLLKQADEAHHPPRKTWALAHRLYSAAWDARDERICRVALPAGNGRVRYARLLKEAAAAESRDAKERVGKLNLDAKGFAKYLTPGAASGDGPQDSLMRMLVGAEMPQHLSCWLANEAPDELITRAPGQLRGSSSSRGGGLALAPRWACLLGTNDGHHPFCTSKQQPPISAAGGAMPRPRLCIALLLRGAPVGCVTGFIAYHLAVGFERIHLYFDDVGETNAIEAARRYESSGVVVTLCTESYWMRQRRTNSFFQDGRGRGMGYEDCGYNGGGPELRCGLNTENFEKGDVQSRQCVVVQEAIGLAASDGFDWLLHVDIDELWYSPIPSARRDAPAVFAAAPESVLQLIFPNHEAVPQMEDSDVTHAPPSDKPIRTPSLHGRAPLQSAAVALFCFALRLLRLEAMSDSSIVVSRLCTTLPVLVHIAHALQGA